MNSRWNEYNVVAINNMTHEAFIDLLTAMIWAFQDIYRGSDDSRIETEAACGLDHVIACFTAQRYDTECETGYATDRLKLTLIEPNAYTIRLRVMGWVADYAVAYAEKNTVYVEGREGAIK